MTRSTVDLVPGIEVGGSPLSDDWMAALTSLRVEREVGLIGRATLRFRDLGYSLSAGDVFALGKSRDDQAAGRRPPAGGERHRGQPRPRRPRRARAPRHRRRRRLQADERHPGDHLPQRHLYRRDLPDRPAARPHPEGDGRQPQDGVPAAGRNRPGVPELGLRAARLQLVDRRADAGGQEAGARLAGHHADLRRGPGRVLGPSLGAAAERGECARLEPRRPARGHREERLRDRGGYPRLRQELRRLEAGGEADPQPRPPSPTAVR